MRPARAAAAFLLGASLLAVPRPAAGCGEGETLRDALERAADIQDPARRRAAGREVLARPDATPEALLALGKSLGRFTARPAGPRKETVPLWTGERTEDIEVHSYVPPGIRPGTRAPLLLHLHGSGSAGDEGGMWKAAADALGMVVVAPTDPRSGEGYRYSPGERALALSALRWARRTFDTDENRVFLGGVSRGGHLCWDLVLRRPDLFAAAAPMIGGPRVSNAAGENNMRFLENVARLPICDLQGSQDHPMLLENLHMAFERLLKWKARATLVEFPDRGHDFDHKAVDWVAFLGGARRDPRPETVVRRCVAGDEGRFAWAEVLRTAKGIEGFFQMAVDGKEWQALSEDERRRRFEAEAERRTARLEVRMEAPGRFAARGTGVERFRLLLDEGMLVPGKPVEVSWQGKTLARAVKPDGRVLLEDILERLDRTFLPVAEVVIP